MQNAILFKHLYQVKMIKGETLSVSFLWLGVSVQVIFFSFLLHKNPTALYLCDVHIAFHFMEYYDDNNSKHTSAAKTKTL